MLYLHILAYLQFQHVDPCGYIVGMLLIFNWVHPCGYVIEFIDIQFTNNWNKNGYIVAGIDLAFEGFPMCSVMWACHKACWWSMFHVVYP